MHARFMFNDSNNKNEEDIHFSEEEKKKSRQKQVPMKQYKPNEIELRFNLTT